MPKTVSIPVRFPDLEAEAIQARAQSEGISTSELIRRIYRASVDADLFAEMMTHKFDQFKREWLEELGKELENFTIEEETSTD